MEFKNIKQLKKEIGCGKRVMYQDRENTARFFTCGKKKKCYNCELKEVEFQTLKQVCKEIKRNINALKAAETCKGVDMGKTDAQIHILKFILTEFQGEEK